MANFNRKLGIDYVLDFVSNLADKN
jgi:hypothetical protein